MLENWCWQKEALRRLSSHYETGDPLPDDLMETLIRSRQANAGCLNMRQITLATFDQVFQFVPSCRTITLFLLYGDTHGVFLAGYSHVSQSRHSRNIGRGHEASLPV